MGMIKKCVVFAGLALATIVAPAIAKADYIALAVNNYGYGEARSFDMDIARAIAVDLCEARTDEPCYRTVSVESHWYLVVITCTNGWNSIGASQISYETAKWIAASRAGCESFYTVATY